MANFGDQYSFVVQVNATGVGPAVQQVDQLGEAAEQAAHRYTGAAGRMNRSSQQLGQGLMNVTYIMDDIQYGTRAIVNQVPLLATSILGFGAASAIAAAGGTVLLSVFRKQIDEALAYAGILDENLVKAMERSTGSANVFVEALEELRQKYRDASKDLRDQAEEVAGAFGDSGRLISDAVAKLMFDEGLDSEIRRRMEALKEQNRDLARTITADNEQAVLTRMDGIKKQIRQLEQEEARRLKAAQDSLAELQQQAIEGDQEAIKRLSDAAFEAFDRNKDEQFSELGQRLFELTDDFKRAANGAEILNIQLDKQVKLEEELARSQKERWEAGEKARQEEIAGIFEQMRVEQAAEEERRRRVNERRQAEELGKLNRRAQRAVEAFGPYFQQAIQQDLQGGLRRGEGPEQAIMNTIGRLSRHLESLGVESGAAGQAANHMVEQFEGGVYRIVDAWNAQGAVMNQMLGVSTNMAQLYQQMRADQLRWIQQAQGVRDLLTRQSRSRRGNMLGTFRPF